MNTHHRAASNTKVPHTAKTGMHTCTPARQALLRMMLVLAKTFKRLRDACLDIVFAHAQGNGKLFDRAAMGFLENAHIVAAGLLCLRFCVMNAATHGLCDLNRGGGHLA